MRRFWFLALGMVAMMGMAVGEVADPKGRFAEEFASFKKQDEAKAFGPGGVVFTGSSSIRLMNTAKVFPKLRALNRGFGGCHVSEVNDQLDLCVLKHRPALVVLYAGGNDLWDRKTVEQVAEDLREFLGRVWEKLPETRVMVLAVRPSASRESIRDREIALNAMYRKIAEADSRSTFVEESFSRYLDEKGRVIDSLFVEDRLHMSDEGYRLWGEFLTPKIEAELAKVK